ncbi:hypothetical protein CFAEC_08380 [Corynebacterium faecale]|nr:hypothetical protein CFAEC_08380 [Corynebacterium faecale]
MIHTLHAQLFELEFSLHLDSAHLSAWVILAQSTLLGHFKVITEPYPYIPEIFT